MLSDEAIPLLYMDSSAPPIISTVVPNYGPVYEPTPLVITGWNLAPTGDGLRCRLGMAPFTRAGWQGNATIAVIAPPASYQFVLGGENAADVDERRGIGTVDVRVSIDGGALLQSPAHGWGHTCTYTCTCTWMGAHIHIHVHR